MIARLETEPMHDRGCPRPGAIAVDGLQRGIIFSECNGSIGGFRVRDGGKYAAQFGVPIQYEFDRGAIAGCNFLFDMSNLEVSRPVDIAVIRGEIAADGCKQARLAGAVGAGDPDPIAAEDREISLLEQRLRTAPQGEIPSR